MAVHCFLNFFFRTVFLAFLFSSLWFWQPAVSDFVEVGADGETVTIEETFRRGRCCVCESALVSQSVEHSDILEFHNKSCDSSEVNRAQEAGARQITLTFVTPWNGRGNDWAENNAHRFSHVSPVWFEVKHLGGKKGVSVLGAHNVDTAWVRSLQSNGVKVVPRVNVDSATWNQNQRISRLLTRKKSQKRFVGRIASVVSKFGFDGVVMELTPLFRGIYETSSKTGGGLEVSTRLKKRLDLLLKRLGRRIHFLNSERTGDNAPGQYLIAVTLGDLSLLNLEQLQPFLTGVPLMTYDFSLHRGGSAGPNAPIRGFLQPVIGETMTRVIAKFPLFPMHKLLLGLNFYGYRFNSAATQGPEAVVGVSTLVEQIIEGPNDEVSHWTWRWHQEFEEHSLNRNDGSAVIWYPTLHSIDKRLAFAQKHGMGISIWELGQGLEYFMQLL